MAENRASGSSFDRTVSDAKKQAEGVVREIKGAAEDVYGQARDSAAHVADFGRRRSIANDKLV